MSYLHAVCLDKWRNIYAILFISFHRMNDYKFIILYRIIPCCYNSVTRHTATATTTATTTTTIGTYTT